MDYKSKYIKYKIKYLSLKGGSYVLRDAIVSWYIQEMKKIVKEDFNEEITITSSELKQKEKTDKELLEILKKHKKLYEYIDNPDNKHINMIINVYREEFKIQLEKKIISERSYIVKIIYFIFNFIFSIFKTKKEDSTDLDDFDYEQEETESRKIINKLLEETEELEKVGQLNKKQADELEKVGQLNKKQAEELEYYEELSEKQAKQLESDKKLFEKVNKFVPDALNYIKEVELSEKKKSNENQAKMINQLRLKQSFDNLKKNRLLTLSNKEKVEKLQGEFNTHLEKLRGKLEAVERLQQSEATDKQAQEIKNLEDDIEFIEDINKNLNKFKSDEVNTIYKYIYECFRKKEKRDTLDCKLTFEGINDILKKLMFYDVDGIPNRADAVDETPNPLFNSFINT